MAPLLKARKMAWSTKAYVPGTSIVNSTMVAPPGGILVVCTLRCETSVPVDVVENLSDHMEGRGQVRSAVADEETYRFTDLCLQCAGSGEGTDAAVEYDVIRILTDRLVHREGLKSLLVVSADRVKFALHNVVLTVDIG